MDSLLGLSPRAAVTIRLQSVAQGPRLGARCRMISLWSSAANHCAGFDSS
jgi:hypothetical protein